MCVGFTLYEIMITLVLISGLGYLFVQSFQTVIRVQQDIRGMRDRLHEVNLLHQILLFESYRGGKLKAMEDGRSVIIQRIDGRTRIISVNEKADETVVTMGLMDEVRRTVLNSRKILRLGNVSHIGLKVLENNTLSVTIEIAGKPLVQLVAPFTKNENNMVYRRIS